MVLVRVLAWQGSWVLVLVVGDCLWSRSFVGVVRGGSGPLWAVPFLRSVS
jgi:hypothetical protein